MQLAALQSLLLFNSLYKMSKYMVKKQMHIHVHNLVLTQKRILLHLRDICMFMCHLMSDTLIEIHSEKCIVR